MKKLSLLVAILAILSSCGNKKPQQNVVFNPGATASSQMSDAEREAKIAAKRNEYKAQNNVMSNIADFAGSIKITVMVPADDNISAAAQRQIENKLIHCAEKPDNARRIIYSDSLVWNSKLVYSWDYDGPAVRNIICT